MTDIDFYVDALLSGLVCRVGPGSSAEEIEGVLGGSFIDDARKQSMRRDYGLVEFQFNRVERAWICFGVSVQIHRLNDAALKDIPPVLIDRYGTFAATVGIGSLARAVGAREGRNFIREEAVGEFVRYRLDGTSSLVHASRDQSDLADDSRDCEKVWSIEIRGPRPS